MPGVSRADAGKPALPFLVGADVSALAQVEQRGGIFRDEGKPGDCLSIFARHGWNCFRLRLFVDPNGRGGAINNLDYTIALARRIHAAGATFMLDIHYSDTWADPQHQVIPAAWNKLPFDDLVKQVQHYTADVLRAFKKNGAMPRIVQVGNEITGGTLWPVAQVEVPHSTIKVYDSTVRVIEPPQPYDDSLQWDRLTRILKAGARGVREATEPTDDVRIMIHIDCGGDWPVTQWFFDHLQQHNVDYDLIGQSYYPYWHGTMENVRQNLAQTAARFGKPIIIVETSYPWTDSANWSRRRNMAWPISPDGQRQFLTELVQTVQQTPNQLGVGVIYWFPESVAMRGNGQRIWNGGDMALFDHDGNALPALDLPESLAAGRGDAADERALSQHK
jgi:arabinogalactan endo-1,4-beta-galactosidase